jgi:hypothetical protein
LFIVAVPEIFSDDVHVTALNVVKPVIYNDVYVPGIRNDFFAPPPGNLKHRVGPGPGGGRPLKRSTRTMPLQTPTTVSYLIGCFVMLLGVVLPIGWYFLKNKQAVSGSWISPGHKSF